MFSSNDTVRLPSNERVVELTGARDALAAGATQWEVGAKLIDDDY